MIKQLTNYTYQWILIETIGKRLLFYIKIVTTWGIIIIEIILYFNYIFLYIIIIY